MPLRENAEFQSALFAAWSSRNKPETLTMSDYNLKGTHSSLLQFTQFVGHKTLTEFKGIEEELENQAKLTGHNEKPVSKY